MLSGLIKMTSEKTNANNLSSSEAGLTLIECLVAISVIAITVATIAPMMVFSVATRVQNQKTEQALQLAQAEVDKVRLTVDQGGDYGQRLRDMFLFSSPASTVLGVAAPTTFVASTASVTSVTGARQVDTDGDGTNDFAIQIFRTTGIELAPAIAGAPSTPVAFNMGVRVYDARASTASLLTDDAGLAFTSGTGQRSNRPLAVLYSQIVQGDRTGSLCQYWQFTGSTPTSLLCN
jgi:prepilin-type N-terminal cleavage/methylation domain-containing protein